jgi:hypothetical protein
MEFREKQTGNISMKFIEKKSASCRFIQQWGTCPLCARYGRMDLDRLDGIVSCPNCGDMPLSFTEQLKERGIEYV